MSQLQFQNSQHSAIRWRVVVFTTSIGAYAFLDGLLASLGHKIVGVVTSPGPRAMRSEEYREVVAAAKPGVDVIVSTHPRRWAAMVGAMQPDLIISAAFPLRIPAEVIALPRLGAINGHDSLLPKYRGPNPQGWVFRNNEAETGYTIHRLTPKFDTGSILAQARIPLTEDDDIDSLAGRLMPLVPDVFTVALERVARGETGEPQDERAASRAPFFEDAWRTVDWSSPARTIHNQIRSQFGLPGHPAGALADIDGFPVRLLCSRIEPERPDAASRQAQPGTLLDADDEGLVVQCGDGLLRITRFEEIEGDV